MIAEYVSKDYRSCIIHTARALVRSYIDYPYQNVTDVILNRYANLIKIKTFRFGKLVMIGSPV